MSHFDHREPLTDADQSDRRLTEALNPRTRGIDRADPSEIVRMIQEEDRRVPEAVEEIADELAAVIRDVSGRLREGGRLFYVGAGTSGRLGVLDAAECPPTFGTDPDLVQGIIAGGHPALVRSREGVEDDREAGRADLRRAGVREGDFVLGIATSGSTPYVRAAVLEARRLGAGTGFLSCTPPPPDMEEAADHLLTPLVGPEVIAGSTRMKAGTATKLALNTLSTGVMVRLGKVYRNWMVDLQAVSRKLADRSVRIVTAASGRESAEARRALVGAGGSAKVAIAMLALGVGRASAERLLDAEDGFLGRVLERWSGASDRPYYGCYGEEFGPKAAWRLRERLREGPSRLRCAVAEARSADGGGSATAGGSPGEGASLRGTAALGGWTAGEHLAHLIETERAAYRSRLERWFDAGPDEAPEFPDWQPPDPPTGRERPVGELLNGFREEREATMVIVDDLEGEDWGRRARVAGEEVAIHQFLRAVAQHDEAHAARITQRVHTDLLDARTEPGRPGSGRAP